ncbi:hypothetical protein M758_UG247900 [Ceratodon purpureus]|nr:hypothetical protein M758_UG247900 [Ceratodon purpureus]
MQHGRRLEKKGEESGYGKGCKSGVARAGVGVGRGEGWAGARARARAGSAWTEVSGRGVGALEKLGGGGEGRYAAAELRLLGRGGGAGEVCGRGALSSKLLSSKL